MKARRSTRKKGAPQRFGDEEKSKIKKISSQKQRASQSLNSTPPQSNSRKKQKKDNEEKNLEKVESTTESPLVEKSLKELQPSFTSTPESTSSSAVLKNDEQLSQVQSRNDTKTATSDKIETESKVDKGTVREDGLQDGTSKSTLSKGEDVPKKPRKSIGLSRKAGTKHNVPKSTKDNETVKSKATTSGNKKAAVEIEHSEVVTVSNGLEKKKANTPAESVKSTQQLIQQENSETKTTPKRKREADELHADTKPTENVPTQQMQMQMQMQMQGFTTGRGKKVNISAESLKKAQQFMMDAGDGVEDEMNNPDVNSIDKAPIQGFSTGRGEKLTVSKESLHRAQQRMQLDDDDIHSNQTSGVDTQYNNGFTTGRGEKVNVSEEALKRAQQLMQVDEDHPPEQPQTSATKFQGFRTGRGQKVDISAESMKKAQQLMQVDEDHPPAHQFMEDSVVNTNETTTTRLEQNSFQGFTTGMGKKVHISAASLQKAQQMLRDDEKSLDEDAEAGQHKQAPEPKLPVFQGFTTGKGKKVTVSAESINRANQLLKEDLSADESVNKTSNQSDGFSTGTGKKLNISAAALKKAQQFMQEDDTKLDSDTLEAKGQPLFQGFTTGTGKKVTVAKESLERAQKLMQDNEDTASGNTALQTQPFQGFQTGSGKRVNISAESMKKAQQILKEETDAPAIEPQVKSFQGFTTGTGKKVNISAASMKKAQQLFRDDNTDMTDAPIEPPANKGAFQGFTTGTGKKVKVSEESMKKAQQFMQSDEDNLSSAAPNATFQGFTTGTGKKVNISAESMQKAQQLIRNDENPLPVQPQALQGFTTGSGKKVNVSAESLKKAQQLMMDDDTEMHEAPPPSVKLNSFQGFTTGTGKKVNVSAESMKKAQQLMRDDDIDAPSIEPPANKGAFQGFTTGSGKKVNVSAESLKKAQQLMTDDDTEMHETPQPTIKPQVNVFQGFTTGTGKKVNVSAESMKKAQQLLRDDDENAPSIEPPATKGAFQGFTTGTGKQVKVSEESMKKAQQFMQSDEDLSSAANASFQGFTTGSGKKVNVSAASLKKAQQLMHDDTEMHEAPPPTVKPQVNSFQGFTTGTGKKVNVSAESMKKAQQLLQDDEEHPLPDQPQALEGFTTGSGKKVNVSAESLKKAQQLMMDDTEMREAPPEPTVKPQLTSFQGFTTGTGKKVSVSAESMKKAQQLMRDDEDVIEEKSQVKSSMPTGFQGFTTGKGNKVNISEESMKKAQQLLRDEEDMNDEKSQVKSSTSAGFQGFTTGKGNKVSISEESMKNAQNLFKEDDDMQHLPQNKKRERDEEPKLQGFQTGGGKRVHISEESMKRAQNIFREEMDTENASQPTLNRQASTQDDEDFLLDMFNSSQAESQHKDEFTEVKPTKMIQETPLHHVPKTSSREASVGNMISPQQSVTPPTSTPSATLSSTPLSDQEKQKEIELLTQDIDFDMEFPIQTVPITPLQAEATPTDSRSFKVASRSKNKFSYPSTPQGIVTSTPTRLPLGLRPVPTTPMNSTSTVNSAFGRNTFPVAKTQTVHTSPAPTLFPMKNAAPATLPMNKSKGFHMPRKLSFNNAQPAASSPLNLVAPPKPTPKKLTMFDLNTKHKKTSLKELAKRGERPGNAENARKFGVSEEVINMTSHAAKEFRFKDSTGNTIELDYLRQVLIGEGANEKLLTMAWIANHYRWIVWKLCCMERSFPTYFLNYLCLERVLSQLRYRYEREINRAHRSALKKILEKDESSTKYMILVVSAIKSYGDDDYLSSLSEDNKPKEEKQEDVTTAPKPEGVIELSDGWYGISTVLDETLTKHLLLGRISVGQKLRIFGAQIVGSEQPVAPLDMTDTTMLRICCNGTRRAKWYAKLGIQPQKAFSICLSSVAATGGMIPSVDVIVKRQYPLQYMESLPDGTRVTRNQRMEAQVQQQFATKREKLVEELTRTWKPTDTSKAPEPPKRNGFVLPRQRQKPTPLSEITDGAELYEKMTAFKGDPEDFMQKLNRAQQNALQYYRQQLLIKQQEQFNAEVMQKMTEEEREVTPFLRLRLMDCPPSDSVKPEKRSECVLTIWRPTEDIIELTQDGKRLRIYGVLPAKKQTPDGVLQLSTTRYTHWEAVPHTAFTSTLFTPRSSIPFDQLVKLKNADIFDTVGVLIHADEPMETLDIKSRQQYVQHIYLLDPTTTLLSVEFRDTSPTPFKMQTDSLVVLGFTNLIYRSYDSVFNIHSCLKCDDTEISTTAKPKFIAKAFESLCTWLNSAESEQIITAAQTKLFDLMNGINTSQHQVNTPMKSPIDTSLPIHINQDISPPKPIFNSTLMTPSQQETQVSSPLLQVVDGTICQFSTPHSDPMKTNNFLCNRTDGQFINPCCRHILPRSNDASDATDVNFFLDISVKGEQRTLKFTQILFTKLIQAALADDSTLTSWLHNFSKSGSSASKSLLCESLAQLRLAVLQEFKTNSTLDELVMNILSYGVVMGQLDEFASSDQISLDHLSSTLRNCYQIESCRVCRMSNTTDHLLFFADEEWTLFSQHLSNALSALNVQYVLKQDVNFFNVLEFMKSDELLMSQEQ